MHNHNGKSNELGYHIHNQTRKHVTDEGRLLFVSPQGSSKMETTTRDGHHNMLILSLTLHPRGIFALCQTNPKGLLGVEF